MDRLEASVPGLQTETGDYISQTSDFIFQILSPPIFPVISLSCWEHAQRWQTEHLST